MSRNILDNKIFKDFMKHKYINLSIIGVAVLICFFIIWFSDKNNKKINDINKLKEDNEITINDNNEEKENHIEIPDRRENFKEAFSKNRETVGWIYIPGTTIDWPVMKGIDNNYYLRRNEKKEYSFEGCIFGDDDSVFYPFQKLSNNVVIHGHNLDDNPDGKRFAQLIKFQNMEFAKNTPYIFLTTEDAALVYEIYSVFFTDIKFGYIQVGLNEEMQQAMIESSKKRSEYIYNVDVTGRDKIITLSTCTYKYGPYGSNGQKNTRFAIQGKLLKDTDKLKETAEIKKNPTPKEPNLK